MARYTLDTLARAAVFRDAGLKILDALTARRAAVGPKRLRAIDPRGPPSQSSTAGSTPIVAATRTRRQ